jgi:hypothetical protein
MKFSFPRACTDIHEVLHGFLTGAALLWIVGSMPFPQKTASPATAVGVVFGVDLELCTYLEREKTMFEQQTITIK